MDLILVISTGKPGLDTAEAALIWKLKAIDRPNAQLKPLCREAAIEMIAALTPNRELAHCGCRRGQRCFGLCASYGPGMGEGNYRPGRVDKQNVVKWLFAVNAGTISIKNVNGSCGKTATEMRGMAVLVYWIIRNTKNDKFHLLLKDF